MQSKRGSDVAKLEALIELDSLTEVEEEAFSSMLKRLRANPSLTLTDKQRAWIDSACEKHDVDVGATNDVSSGVVAPPTTPMNFSAMGPKVLAPPSRR